MSMGTKEKIWEVLDRAAAEGRPQPSLRNIRTLVGGGSMSTIADAVREWKSSQTPAPDAMPAGMSDAAAQAVVKVVWTALAADLSKYADSVRETAKARTAAEMEVVQQLRTAAEEMLAEADAKEAKLKSAVDTAERLQARLTETESQLTQARQALEELRTQHADLAKRYTEAVADAAKAKGELSGLRSLMPFLPDELGGASLLPKPAKTANKKA